MASVVHSDNFRSANGENLRWERLNFHSTSARSSTQSISTGYDRLPPAPKSWGTTTTQFGILRLVTSGSTHPVLRVDFLYYSLDS